ncbi:translation initiation factor IF-2-like [Accipiter gentilis]|uniref:translation initiation factor IF-2-like n=1 Tax=Astur gentilis TaxID=8957 RepID=UPI00210F4650|nr:translation initiation factor IF-2-like [Accipiter gentilis]
MAPVPPAPPGGVMKNETAGPAGGPDPVPSRLPVRSARAKRPAVGQEEEATVAAAPEQKRARPTPAAPAPARPVRGGRAPLKPLSVAAAARPGTGVLGLGGAAVPAPS